MKRTAVAFLSVAGLSSALFPCQAQALPPEVARAAELGMAQLYRLEFDKAFATFEKLKNDCPDHPAAPTLAAAGLWWQSRYAFTQPSEETSRKVEESVKEAVRRGEIMAKDPAKACEAGIFVGGALGVGAHWELLRGNWFKAAMDARAAVATLKPLLSCSEYAGEACFGLGMYEFAAANLPWHLRWLSAVLISGMNDRTRALERLAQAATEGRFLRSDAQGSLVVAYTVWNPDPEKAVYWSSLMIKERPDSPMAAGLHLQALGYAMRFEELLSAARKWSRAGGQYDIESATFHYWEGVALLGFRRPEDAEKAFSAAISEPGRPVWKAASLLKRGCARDVQGRREEALDDYRAVKKIPDPWLEGERASIYLSRPFTWEDFPREVSPHGI